MPGLSVDQRRAIRRRPDRPIKAELSIEGLGSSLPVCDLSASGLSLDVAGSYASYTPGQDVRINMAGADFQARILYLDEKASRIGLKFHVATQPEAFCFNPDDPSWDLIENHETIQTLIEALASHDPRPLLFVAQGASKAALEVLPGGSRKTIEARVITSEGRALQGGSALFRFDVFDTCHLFCAMIHFMDDRVVRFSSPTELARLLKRRTLRVTAEHLNAFSVRLASSTLGWNAEGMALQDASEYGVSIRNNGLWASLPVGFRIDLVEISTASDGVVQGTGVVRGVAWCAKEQNHLIRIEFEAATYEHRTRWHDAILQARYPSLSFSYKAEADHPRIWDLFDRSKYLALKPRESFQYVFDVSKRTWEKMAQAGTALSKRVLIRKGEAVLGHIQLDRIYPETWCAHALAIDPGVLKTVGKDIYSVTADVLASEGAQFMISITESHLAWNQRNYYDFVKGYRFPEHNELKTFQIHEVEPAKGWRLEGAPGLTIRRANKYDLRRIARYFEIYGSDLERQALGLSLEHLDLEFLNRELSQYGLARRREALVAMQGTRFVGFSLLESGTAGISVFGIQDTLYVHLVPEVLEQRDSYYDAILDASLNRYRELGIPTVNVYVPQVRREYYSERGLKFIWEGIRWITRCECARRYHAFTQVMYGSLLARRAAIRRRRETFRDLD